MNIKTDNKKNNKPFDKFSTVVTKATGSSYAFVVAVLFIVVWACSGPVFHFSDTWQLVVNTATSVITFLMVFIIQQSQNKDTMALQLKLNELIAASSKASNRLIDVEDLTDDELKQLKKFYCDLGELAEKDNNLFTSHSVEEAKDIQNKENKNLKSL
ncbi:low affinity iron permease family protein [Segetibacter koreensis]|uniref:low affinity iron permease family protein n=1 Tax=Segetibacter koreensis TaxID=398037 RepID=UPI00037C6CFE|nr:low affinity iron permease family protein [Segetibacter koreensis]